MNDRLHRRAPAAGFTLLEVLIALALLGFILVALAGGVRFGVRAWQAEERRGAGAAELEAVHGLLRRMVATAQPLPLAGLGPAGASLYFDGRPNEMSFISDLPEAIGGAGPYDLALELTAGGRLVLRWRPHVRPVPGSSPGPYAETELMRGVAALDLRYFVPAINGQPAGWLSEWRQPGTLPALVRVKLRLAEGDRRRAMELVVAPLIGTYGG
jgi:general secretion pathway protein J